MILIDTKTLQIISEQELRERNPLVSFPAVLQPEKLGRFGVAEFIYTPQPSSEFGSVTFGTPIERDGKYYSNWIQDTLPLEQCQQIQLGKIAAIREQHLFKHVIYKGVTVAITQQNIAILQLFSLGSDTFNINGADGWLQLTSRTAKELLKKMQQHVKTVYDIEKQHHDAIMEFSDVNDVIAYNINQGW